VVFSSLKIKDKASLASLALDVRFKPEIGNTDGNKLKNQLNLHPTDAISQKANSINFLANILTIFFSTDLWLPNAKHRHHKTFLKSRSFPIKLMPISLCSVVAAVVCALTGKAIILFLGQVTSVLQQILFVCLSWLVIKSIFK